MAKNADKDPITPTISNQDFARMFMPEKKSGDMPGIKQYALGAVELVNENPEMAKLKGVAFPEILSSGSRVFYIPEFEASDSGSRYRPDQKGKPNFLYHFLKAVNAGEKDLYSTIYYFNYNGYVKNPDMSDSACIGLTGAQILNALRTQGKTWIRPDVYHGETLKKYAETTPIRRKAGDEKTGGYVRLENEVNAWKDIRQKANEILTGQYDYYRSLDPNATTASIDKLPFAIPSNSNFTNFEVGLKQSRMYLFLSSIIQNIQDHRESFLSYISQGEREAGLAQDENGEFNNIRGGYDGRYDYLERELQSLEGDVRQTPQQLRPEGKKKTGRNGEVKNPHTVNDYKNLLDIIKKFTNRLEIIANEIKSAYIKSVPIEERTPIKDETGKIIGYEYNRREGFKENLTGEQLYGRCKIYVSGEAKKDVEDFKPLVKPVDYFYSEGFWREVPAPTTKMVTRQTSKGPKTSEVTGFESQTKFYPKTLVVITDKWADKASEMAISNSSDENGTNHISMERGRRDFIRGDWDKYFKQKSDPKNPDHFPNVILAQRIKRESSSASSQHLAQSFIEAVCDDFAVKGMMNDFRKGFGIPEENPNIDDKLLQDIVSAHSEADMDQYRKQTLNRFSGVVQKAMSYFNNRNMAKEKGKKRALNLFQDDLSSNEINNKLLEYLSDATEKNTIGVTQQKLESCIDHFGLLAYRFGDVAIPFEDSDKTDALRLVLTVAKVLTEKQRKEDTKLYRPGDREIAGTFIRLFQGYSSFGGEANLYDIRQLLVRLLFSPTAGNACKSSEYKELTKTVLEEKKPYYPEILDFIKVYIKKCFPNEGKFAGYQDQTIKYLDDLVKKNGERSKLVLSAGDTSFYIDEDGTRVIERKSKKEHSDRKHWVKDQSKVNNRRQAEKAAAASDTYVRVKISEYDENGAKHSFVTEMPLTYYQKNYAKDPDYELLDKPTE